MSARYGQTIVPFHVFFSTFDMDKLGKVRRRHWKAFPVVAFLPIFGGREATTGNASAVRRLLESLP